MDSISRGLGELLGSVTFWSLTAVMLLYVLLNDRTLFKLTAWCWLMFTIASILKNPLLDMEKELAKILWYLAWQSIAIVQLFGIKKMFFPVIRVRQLSFVLIVLLVIEVLLNAARFFERNIFDTNFFKTAYALGISWAGFVTILALAAPIFRYWATNIKNYKRTKQDHIAQDNSNDYRIDSSSNILNSSVAR